MQFVRSEFDKECTDSNVISFGTMANVCQLYYTNFRLVTCDAKKNLVTEMFFKDSSCKIVDPSEKAKTVFVPFDACIESKIIWPETDVKLKPMCVV